ncbi:unnamed protein product [Pleuronectes platessa]|uniref:Uncharacterized protein n=1 Tax=Pleuronectes platessa TaxID=8262 RepID=A0A9N7TJY3_PLEPL|nr:unnamed protein product [Pleuronectes platessa]
MAPSSDLSQSQLAVCLRHRTQPSPRGGRKRNEELTDRARYCTSTTGQSPANPCADSQDVALIHRPQLRHWGPGKGEQGVGRSADDREHDQEENPQTVSPANSVSDAWRIDRPNVHTPRAQRSDGGREATGDPGVKLREGSAQSQSCLSSWDHNTELDLWFQSTTLA